MGRKRIASVTAAIQAILQTAVSEAVPGAAARIGRPRDAEPGSPEAWLHLHRLGLAGAMRNLPMRHGGGAEPARTAIDLHYLIAFAAQEPLAADLMIERVLARIEALPMLTAAEIGEGVLNFSELSDNDLALQAEPVRLALSDPPTESVAGMWIGLQPTLYVTVSPVLIGRDPSV